MMRVEPFQAISELADCRPGGLVRYVTTSASSKQNALALVVEAEDRSQTELLFLGKSSDKILFQSYRKTVRVITHRETNYSFLVDDDKIELPAGTNGDPPSGTLLLSGGQWFMCVKTDNGEEAYKIAAGQRVRRPDLTTAASFGAWKLVLPQAGTKQVLELLSYLGGGRRP